MKRFPCSGAAFPAVTLSLDSSGGDTFILNSETGYAEK